MGPSHPLEMDSRNPQAYPDNRIGASAPRMHRQSQNQRNISANRRQASDYGVQASQNLPMEEQQQFAQRKASTSPGLRPNEPQRPRTTQGGHEIYRKGN